MKLSEKLASTGTVTETATTKVAESGSAPRPRVRTRTSTPDQRWNSSKKAVHQRLLTELASSSGQLGAPALKAKVRAALDDLLETEDIGVSRLERQRFVQELMGDMLGYGPLDELLGEDDITEIMCNDFDEIWIEREGTISRTDLAFGDMDHYRRIIEKIVVGVGRRVDEASPMVDARLPDGSRVNVILPPLAVKAPVLTIRKFPSSPLSIGDLIRYGSISTDASSFLEACVRAKINVLVSGGTGTGKTTMLNVLSAFIPENERIITIEEAAELQPHQPHTVSLEARPPNAEGAGEVRIRDLVKNSLRMRPDRIIVGECRGAETLDMLQAMNTGHEGSMTTVHANSAREAMSRLEVMVLMSGFDLPIRAIREQIANSINIVVHLERTPSGSRTVSSIAEIQGLESDVIVMQDLFHRTGRTERGPSPLEPTGLRPKLLDLLKDRGVMVDAATFRPDAMDLDRHDRYRQRPTRFRADAVSMKPRGR
ncbi:MAG TPA: CpaF family protein [Acidimicrobiales bacterium]|nr:CpaF family protein [Acidimicrobiales bacterium]